MRRHQRRESRRIEVSEFWPEITRFKAEWLGHALSTVGADRAAAEEAIGRLYGLLGKPPPEFVWIGSPSAVGEVLESSPVTLGFDAEWPLASRVATLISDMRQGLDARLLHLNLSEVDRAVRVPLRETVRTGVADRIRAELTTGHGLYWYGQQDADWVAHYELYQQVLGVQYDQDDAERLLLLAQIVQSCGWWWPRDTVCVIAERPLALRTAEGKLHSDSGPALLYPDGWAVHCWHGARVPAWVIENPTVEAIAAESNIEVRRCAIEHLGWPNYIEQAGLRLIDRADDPGNPGCELRLYEDRPQWKTRILLAVNGSIERDGTRRWYGLRVPPWFDDPLEAAGWSYGLTASQYSRLLRRT